MNHVICHKYTNYSVVVVPFQDRTLYTHEPLLERNVKRIIKSNKN